MTSVCRGHKEQTSRNRIQHASLACIAVFASVLTLVTFAGTAAASTPCAQQVLSDWSDNGRVDRLYALHCYEEAIEALPPDLRDYTNAADVIERALTVALRAEPRPEGGNDTGEGSAVDVETSGASSIPILPAAAGGLALALLLAGGIAYLARRRSA